MMRESPFIEIIREKFKKDSPALIQGIGDDCAHVKGYDGAVQLVTTDMLTHGVHFSERFSSWKDIGWRSVAVNLSDLAASAADPSQPILLFISIAVPTDMSSENLLGFVDGVFECTEHYGAILAGGDSTKTHGPFAVSITAIGYSSYPISRTGAKPGDLLCVCGNLGDAGAGFDLLDSGKSAGAPDLLITAFTRPSPLLDVGFALASSGAVKAMIDVSDGLLKDAYHLLEDTECDLLLKIDDLPVSTSAIEIMGESKAFELAAGFGDDYALLLVVSPSLLEKAVSISKIKGTRFTTIGEFKEGGQSVISSLRGEPFSVPKAGYQHILGK